MTVKELLEITDSVKENKLCDDVKLRWINDVEGRISCEIHGMSPEAFIPHTSDDDVLLVPDAYSSLYLLYLVSMIAFSNGDFSLYSTSNIKFEEMLHRYAKHCIRSR
jgi:hypothetical protein